MTTTENEQRDELVSLLWCKIVTHGGAGASIRLDANAAHVIAGTILTAGYRKPRTITTVEELDALREGAVIVDRDGDAWQFLRGRWTCTDRSFNTVNQPSSSLAMVLAPLTLLREPEAEAGA